MRIEQTVPCEGRSDPRAFPQALGAAAGMSLQSSRSQRSCTSFVFVKSFPSLPAKLILCHQLIQGFTELKGGVLWIHLMPFYWEERRGLRIKCWVYFYIVAFPRQSRGRTCGEGSLVLCGRDPWVWCLLGQHGRGRLSWYSPRGPKVGMRSSPTPTPQPCCLRPGSTTTLLFIQALPEITGSSALGSLTGSQNNFQYTRQKSEFAASVLYPLKIPKFMLQVDPSSLLPNI